MTDNPEPRAHQHVIAKNGFAYGAIGADIHVLGDDVPVYVLENRRPPPEVDAAWLRQAPSRMLNARFAVVGFTGRTDELAELRGWREQDAPLSAQWIFGPGGAGKSRLADRLA
ncbi:hypothetical protein AB0C29_35720, partial [Actinoplanes sp. NPDC048791]|uniref:hypothetical protein n=1 Tax=Actinoplanes sp. NPDC048791 TaxID=3154623 RepID=UPI003402EFAC